MAKFVSGRDNEVKSPDPHLAFVADRKHPLGVGRI